VKLWLGWQIVGGRGAAPACWGRTAPQRTLRFLHGRPHSVLGMGRRFRDFCTDDTAVSSIEYALMAAGLAVVTITAIKPAQVSPRCPACGMPMEFVTTISRFEFHPELRGFQCKKCGKMEFRGMATPECSQLFRLAQFDHVGRSALRPVVATVLLLLKAHFDIVHYFNQALCTDHVVCSKFFLKLALDLHPFQKLTDSLARQFSAVPSGKLVYVAQVVRSAVNDHLRMFGRCWSPFGSLMAFRHQRQN
jgi:Flp pilus assembly pilin Flp